MLENIPLHLLITFLLATGFVSYMFLKACHWNKKVMTLFAIWLPLQAYLGYSGFYLDSIAIPPHMLFMIPPTLVAMLITFYTKRGQSFINSLDLKTLTLLHLVRIPVEFCLLWLFIAGAIPELMTFEGRNFDILAGITAPIVFYFYFTKKSLRSTGMLTWNIVSLALLINIIINALLSAPLPIQQFAFDQPNIGILYFPFVWLPSFIVPIVFFSHLVVIRRLRKEIYSGVKK
jgi:hypothetical protein